MGCSRMQIYLVLKRKLVGLLSARCRCSDRHGRRSARLKRIPDDLFSVDLCVNSGGGKVLVGVIDLSCFTVGAAHLYVVRYQTTFREADSRVKTVTLDIPTRPKAARPPTSAAVVVEAAALSPISAAWALCAPSPVFITATLIRTTRGDRAVEALIVGDIAVNATGETRPIRWLGHRTGRLPARPAHNAADSYRRACLAARPSCARPLRLARSRHLRRCSRRGADPGRCVGQRIDH